MNLKAAVVLAIGIAGMLLLWWNDWGNIRKPPFIHNSVDWRVTEEGQVAYIKYSFFDPLKYILSLEAGLLMVSGCLSYLYWQASRDLHGTRGIILSAFLCSLMPIFELLGLIPWWWICIILIPTVGLGGLWLNWKKVKDVLRKWE